MKLLNYFKGVNIYLLILDILFFIISFLFFNEKKCKQRIKDLFVVLYTLFNIYLFGYLNDFFDVVFDFSNISMKVYLIAVIITYIIFLGTINKKKIKKIYKVINIVLFATVNVIFAVNIYIVLSVKMVSLPTFEMDNPKLLNNITIMILIGYCILISLLYIINSLISFVNNKKNLLKKNEVEFDEETLEIGTKDLSDPVMMNVEELLNYDRNNTLYINGVDCSIIFNDSNRENIIKNYHILSNNIEAKMVNGYTLDENKMLKDICIKLNTNNLVDINLDNFNILNKISVEEYNLLKKIKGNY